MSEASRWEAEEKEWMERSKKRNRQGKSGGQQRQEGMAGRWLEGADARERGREAQQTDAANTPHAGAEHFGKMQAAMEDDID